MLCLLTEEITILLQNTMGMTPIKTNR